MQYRCVLRCGESLLLFTVDCTCPCSAQDDYWKRRFWAGVMTIDGSKRDGPGVLTYRDKPDVCMGNWRNDWQHGYMVTFPSCEGEGKEYKVESNEEGSHEAKPVARKPSLVRAALCCVGPGRAVALSRCLAACAICLLLCSLLLRLVPVSLPLCFCFSRLADGDAEPDARVRDQILQRQRRRRGRTVLLVRQEPRPGEETARPGRPMCVVRFGTALLAVAGALTGCPCACACACACAFAFLCAGYRTDQPRVHLGTWVEDQQQGITVQGSDSSDIEFLFFRNNKPFHRKADEPDMESDQCIEKAPDLVSKQVGRLLAECGPLSLTCCLAAWSWRRPAASRLTTR